jgi:AcrR family transcriptional regulator
MADLVRPYRGVSADERRAQRRERLIDAALDLIGSGGIAEITMKGICARAGLTERYFYESFRNVDELLIAVIDHVLAAVDIAIHDALAEAPRDLRERARAAAGALLAVLTNDPRSGRAYIEAAGTPGLRQRQTTALTANARLVAEQMRELGGLKSVPRERIQLAAVVLVGGAERAIEAWAAGTLKISRGVLIDDIAQLCVAAADALRGEGKHALTSHPDDYPAAQEP